MLYLTIHELIGLEISYEENWDPIQRISHQSPKRVPYLIVYRKDKAKLSKKPDDHDLEVIRKISALPYPEFPVVEIPDMQMMRVGRMKPSKITHLHHFFLKRPLFTLASFWKKASQIPDPDLRAKALFFVEQSVWGLSVLARYAPTHFSQVNQYLSGVFYMASHIVDVSPRYILGGKAKRLATVFGNLRAKRQHVVTATQDTSNLGVPANSLDYAFIDPPFGENIYYSDLNMLVESLHGVVTDPKSEAIIDRVRGKEFAHYQLLMTDCFRMVYDSLKPGRWLTVEFSNSNAKIWNLIQTSLGSAGFVVSNVSALDKKQRSFQSIVSPTAVKQDLVISSYKPNGGFEERFRNEAKTEEGVWDFVRNHLRYLPITKQQGASLQFVPERDPRILFDQMVAYYVHKGYLVPISSQEFQMGLGQRFIERDGMYFLPEQSAEYDKKRMSFGQFVQATLFVSDEESSIQWLSQLLGPKPQSYQDLYPQFIQETQRAWNKNESSLELSTLLEQNFLRYDGKGPVPEQIHAYLSTNWRELRRLPKDDPTLVAKARDRWYVPDPNKAGDLEKLREKALLKEFEEYKETKKRLKVFRLEAVRAGFKKAWQEHDYTVIVAVADKIPNNVLEEDPKLLMWYDQAVTRTVRESP